jgi:hypothetical protein
MPMDEHRFAAWAGLIGPTLFVAIFTLEGWFRPGYAPLPCLRRFTALAWAGAQDPGVNGVHWDPYDTKVDGTVLC